MRPAALLSALALVGVLGCCTFVRSPAEKAQIEQRNQASTIAGELRVRTNSDSPIVIGLLHQGEQGDARAVTYRVRYGSGPFEFPCLPGDYIVFAFADANQDLAFQRGEDAGWHGTPTIVTTTPGDAFTVSISLRAPSEASKHLPQLYENQGSLGQVDLTTDRDGEIITLDDPRVATKIGELGMWEPDKFVAGGYDGIYFLDAYSPDKVPIILVHGMQGTANDWRFFTENIDREKFQPWLVQYPSGSRLDLVADHIHHSLTKLHLRHGFKQSCLVAHSVGGLIAKAVERRCEANGNDWLQHLITYSTPWGGLESARSGVDMSPVIVPAWFDISPESPFLHALFESQTSPQIPHWLAFSYGGSPGVLGGPNTDGVVPMHSQLLRRAQQNTRRTDGFDADHAGILKHPGAVALLTEALEALADRR